MNKSTAIQKFTEGCADRANYEQRRHSVGYQCNRNSWQVNHKDGIARIERYTSRNTDTSRNTYVIIFWPSIDYAKITGISPKWDAELSEQEYKNLEHLFKGNFKPNIPYLRKYNPELWPKKKLNLKGFTLIWLPLGAGIAILMAIGFGARNMGWTIGWFVLSVVIWLAHVIYKIKSK